MPFIGPLKGACPGLCPQKARRHSLLKKKHKLLLFSDLNFYVILLSKKLEECLLFFLTSNLCATLLFWAAKSPLAFL